MQLMNIYSILARQLKRKADLNSSGDPSTSHSVDVHSTCLV